jgi:hypothetical protein
VASAAGFAFFLVGRGIWRDLRVQRKPAKPEGKNEQSSAEDGRR